MRFVVHQEGRNPATWLQRCRPVRHLVARVKVTFDGEVMASHSASVSQSRLNVAHLVVDGRLMAAERHERVGASIAVAIIAASGSSTADTVAAYFKRFSKIEQDAMREIGFS